MPQAGRVEAAYVVYLAIVLGRVGQAPVTHVSYVAVLLWTIGASIAASIVGRILVETAKPSDTRRSDVRESVCRWTRCFSIRMASSDCDGGSRQPVPWTSRLETIEPTSGPARRASAQPCGIGAVFRRFFSTSATSLWLMGYSGQGRTVLVEQAESADGWSLYIRRR
jgi:hypothetical protein